MTKEQIAELAKIISSTYFDNLKNKRNPWEVVVEKMLEELKKEQVA